MCKTFWILDCVVTITDTTILIFDRYLNINWAKKGKFAGTQKEAEEAVAEWMARVYY